MGTTICRKMNLADCPKVAKIHLKELGEDFLPSLGLDFLTSIYYPAVLRDRNSSVFVVEIGEQIAGFVNVSLSPSDLFKSIALNHPFSIGLATVKLLFSKPYRLWEALQIVQSKSPVNLTGGEIVFIAVNSQFQKLGVGRLLVEEANWYFSKNGKTHAWTKTLLNNTVVEKLYRPWGAQQFTTLQIYNKFYQYLRWQLPLEGK